MQPSLTDRALPQGKEQDPRYILFGNPGSQERPAKREKRANSGGGSAGLQYASSTSLDTSDYLHIEDHWRDYLQQNQQLADALDSVGYAKSASKVRHCHRCFKVYVPQCLAGSPERLKHNVAQPIESCFNRLCPMCARIRTARAIRKLGEVFRKVKSPKLLTLTVRNVPHIDKAYITWLGKCFSKLRRRRFFSAACRGGVYSLETTYNRDEKTWHVHIHALLESGFISQPGLVSAWSEITQGEGFIVDIRQADQGSILEVLKYVVKGSDIIDRPELVKEFIDATERKRMLSTFGDFYGFQFDEQEQEFPPCPVCASTDRKHYLVDVGLSRVPIGFIVRRSENGKPPYLRYCPTSGPPG